MFRADSNAFGPRAKKQFLMRAEIQTIVDEIKQAIALLRRHL